jgi:hypothetical protein
MAQRGILNLGTLAIDHESEIEEMLDGIQGNPESVLWTSQIRPATRGGAPKCMAIPQIIENAP